MKYALLTLSLILLRSQAVLADVRLPAIFSDHMVLQQDVTVPVWGWAAPGEEVFVSIGGQTKSTRADSQGKWKVELDKLKSGDTLMLVVKGKNTLTVNDVLVGEVWLGSGQSNMTRTTKMAKDFEKEKAASDLPRIRMFRVGADASAPDQPNCRGSWKVCSPETVGEFSGVLFFFGRELYSSLEVPVGLIHSSVGGTAIELWTDLEAQRGAPQLRDHVASMLMRTNSAPANGKKAPAPPKPGRLFDTLIAPIIPYAMRGIVWYQGEANGKTVESARRYEYQLPLLITDWRARWGSEVPFGYVQLPNLTQGENWPLVREGMLKTLKLPKTGMAVTVDIGEPNDVHPHNKEEVGRRLSLWALGAVYQKPVPATSGPLPASHKVQGGDIVISFSHTEGGLVAKGGELRGFLVSGEDRQWHPANGRISGEQVVVSSSEVKKPLAVRYAWAANPECNLYNGAGLPASPFRTDDWK
jgi:sialate O-acetylesterase